MKGSGFIYVIGFLAQAFFSARIIFQWILSEKAKKVVSPSIFWILSIAGSYLLCIYGWLRDDFSIIFGQFISYYIYLWNLNEKGIWNKLHGALKTLLVITPVIAAAFMLHDAQHFIDSFFRNEEVPLWLWGKLFSLSALYINGLIHSIIKSLYCLPASGLSAWSVHRLLWHTVYSVLILC